MTHSFYFIHYRTSPEHFLKKRAGYR